MRSHDDTRPAATAEELSSPGELYRRHARDIHGLLMGLLRDRADADDALQQVFLKLLDGWQSVRPETAKGWLFTVAYREAMSVRRRRHSDDQAIVKLWATPAWRAAGERRDPLDEVARAEETEAVRAALGELPPEQREVIRRKIYHGQTFEAIAWELGCPLGTVLTRMRLGLAKLRRLVEGEPCPTDKKN